MTEFDLLVGDECPVCGGQDALVAPECADGHGPDCPDRLCVDCGVAVFVDPVTSPAAAGLATTASRTA